MSICIYDIYTFLYISYIQKSVYIFCYIYSYIYSIYTLYMKFENDLYICIYIYSVYEILRLCIYTTLCVPKLTYSSIVRLKCCQINIDSLSVYMIYTIFVYIMYIYTVYEILQKLVYMYIYTCM